MIARTKTPVDWRNAPEGTERWRRARAEAQRRADATGFDHGVEKNDLLKDFSVFMLPRWENRYGHELWCEVVSCADLSKCQEGHGPA
jgi:hypothetical protein